MPFSPGSGSPFPRSPKGRSKFNQPQAKDEYRVNERIRVPKVRLVDEKGQQVGVVQTSEALSMARDRGLDLMEVSPNSSPPVCKIADYGKFKYDKKKKEHQAKKKQTTIKVKEVQLRPNTDTHDLDYKFRNARSFLEGGDKVKFNMIFRGRQMAYTDQGFSIMRSTAKKLEDVGVVELPPKMEGRKMIMIMAPTAKKPQKKPSPSPAPKSK